MILAWLHHASPPPTKMTKHLFSLFQFRLLPALYSFAMECAQATCSIDCGYSFNDVLICGNWATHDYFYLILVLLFSFLFFWCLCIVCETYTTSICINRFIYVWMCKCIRSMFACDFVPFS